MALLNVRGLTKRFAGLVANNEIDLAVPEGSLFAVIGPNGAGKTTFFNMLSGFLHPTSGTIEVDGKDITNVRQDKIAAMGLIRTFQLVQMFQGMSVAENVEVGFHLQTRGGIASALIRPPWLRRQEADIRVKARELLDFVGLGAQADMNAELLPYGQQRLLEVARAMAAQPRIAMSFEETAAIARPRLPRLPWLTPATWPRSAPPQLSSIVPGSPSSMTRSTPPTIPSLIAAVSASAVVVPAGSADAICPSWARGFRRFDCES